MRRLTETTLPRFVKRHGLAAVLFGSTSGEVTLAQARAFAHLWVERPCDAYFGFADAKANPALRAAYDLPALPATVVFRDGQAVATLVGFQSMPRLAAALDAAAAGQALAA